MGARHIAKGAIIAKEFMDEVLEKRRAGAEEQKEILEEKQAGKMGLSSK